MEEAGICLTVSGEIGLDTVEAFKCVLSGLIDSYGKVRLDLSGLDFMDASGVGVLAAAAANSGRDQRIEIGPQVTPAVRRVLELTEMDGLLRQKRPMVAALA